MAQHCPQISDCPSHKRPNNSNSRPNNFSTYLYCVDLLWRETKPRAISLFAPVEGVIFTPDSASLIAVDESLQLFAGVSVCDSLRICQMRKTDDIEGYK
jgi:hypothetical protein